MTDTPDPRGISAGLRLPYPDPSSLVRDHPTDHSALTTRLDQIDRWKQQLVTIGITNSPNPGTDIQVGAMMPAALDFATYCTITANVYMGYSSFTGGQFQIALFSNAVIDPNGWGWSVNSAWITAPPALQWIAMPSLTYAVIPVNASGRPDLTLRLTANGPIASYNWTARLAYLSTLR